MSDLGSVSVLCMQAVCGTHVIWGWDWTKGETMMH